MSMTIIIVAIQVLEQFQLTLAAMRRVPPPTQGDQMGAGHRGDGMVCFAGR